MKLVKLKLISMLIILSVLFGCLDNVISDIKHASSYFEANASMNGSKQTMQGGMENVSTIAQELKKCADGTLSGKCSENRPYYCNNGSLINKAPICGCPENYTLNEEECALKSGCVYENPSCDENHSCINNECILKRGCSYSNPPCSQEEGCVNNSCIKLHRACVGASQCESDEVCLDQKCSKAALTLVFVPHAIYTPEYKEIFYEEINASVNDFIGLTPLKGCPEKVRVHILDPAPQCLCSESRDIGYCIDTVISKWNVTVLYHPLNQWEEGKNCISMYRGDGKTSILLALLVDSDGKWDHYPGPLAHELGHSFGLDDEYCYWENTGAPNPVDFNTSDCAEVTDPTSWFYSYCSYHSGLGDKLKPYQCMGNPTATGNCIMGQGSWQRDNPMFCDKCTKHLAAILKCE